MTVGELMNGCVVECTEDAGLEEVYDLLQKCDHRMVIVIDSNAHRVPIGVVTERSICEQIVGRGRNPRTLSAGSVLDSRKIMTVPETQAVEGLDLNYTRDIAAIVVVDENRRARGVVPRERIGNIPVAETTSSNLVFVNTAPRISPAVREIPAFGWIQ